MYRILKKVITFCVRLAYRIIYHLIPTQKHTVLFIAFHGRGCLDNPLALYEYMDSQERFADYRFVWALKEPRTFDSPRTRSVKYLSLSYFFWLARSKYWISNCKLPSYILKKKDQVYLQTWHGTPLKRLAHDIQISSDAKFYRSGLNAQEMQSTYDDDVKKYTYMIAPNSFCTRVFQSAFGIEKERLIETGYPRNDILINADEQKKQEIRARLGIPEGKKVLLYAPTWRDNSFVAAGYTFELQADFRKWKEMLADEYVLLFLERPIYFYMYDLDSYREELRGFYIDIYSDLPGDIYEDEEAMLKDIHEGNFDRERLSQFNARFNEHEDGHASQRVIDIVFGEERS